MESTSSGTVLISVLVLVVLGNVVMRKPYGSLVYCVTSAGWIVTGTVGLKVANLITPVPVPMTVFAIGQAIVLTTVVVHTLLSTNGVQISVVLLSETGKVTTGMMPEALHS